MTQAATPTGTVLLPEHLRLPDMTHLRAVTATEVAAWLDLAAAAAAWGPDQRNGCTRAQGHGQIVWSDREGHPHSPDEWTPPIVHRHSIDWCDHGYSHGTAARPANLETLGDSLTWSFRGGRHRAHAPAVMHEHGHTWWWHAQPDLAPVGCTPGPALTDLLDQAWSPDLTDDQARTLLAQATAPGLDEIGPDLAHLWVAHVIAASTSPHLSAPTQSWCRLLIT